MSLSVLQGLPGRGRGGLFWEGVHSELGGWVHTESRRFPTWPRPRLLALPDWSTESPVITVLDLLQVFNGRMRAKAAGNLEITLLFYPFPSPYPALITISSFSYICEYVSVL